jgi:hypothetical protein
MTGENMIARKSISAAVIVALMATGCAAPGGGSSQASGDNTAMRCALLGVGGALLGAKFIGGKDGALKGAAIGLAACAVIEVATRQTKSSAEVEQQYRVANRNQLPASPKIDAFATVVTPGGAVKAGDAIKVESTVRAVSGASQPVQEVKEVLVAYSPDGQEFKRGEKKLNDNSGSGEYVNSFTLKLPAGAPQGVYRLETTVFLNGQPMVRKESNVQVALAGDLPALATIDR